MHRPSRSQRCTEPDRPWREPPAVCPLATASRQPKLDGYIRVSRVGRCRGERFISPAVQPKHLENWARWRGIELLSVFEELDQSGAGPDRPLLAAAIARIEDGVSDGLAVWSVERFHPSFLDGLLLIERVRTAGGQLCSVEAALTPPLIAAARSRAAGSRTPSPSSTAYAQAGTRAAPTRSASVLSKPRLSLTPLSTRSCCSPRQRGRPWPPSSLRDLPMFS